MAAPGVVINQDDLKRVMELFDPNQAKKIHALVLNKLATRARKESKAAFLKKYNPGKGKILVHLRRAKSSKLEAEIWGRLRPYSLYRFKPEQTSSGVQVQIERGRTIVIPGAFIKRPVGHDWSSRGQQRTRESTVPTALKRANTTAYTLLGDTDLITREQEASIGKFITSAENRFSTNQMIAKQAPILLAQTIADQIKRKAIKEGIDIDSDE